MLAYDTPTGAAESWLLALDGGVPGTVKDKAEAKEMWPKSQVEERKSAIGAVRATRDKLLAYLLACVSD